VDAKTAEMRAEGERILAERARVEVAVPDDRADRIRTLLARRAAADQEIAALLRDEKEERGEAEWLAWTKVEFGWGRSQAFKRLSPSTRASTTPTWGGSTDEMAAMAAARDWAIQCLEAQAKQAARPYGEVVIRRDSLRAGGSGMKRAGEPATTNRETAA
jgi:hypothetical protein